MARLDSFGPALCTITLEETRPGGQPRCRPITASTGPPVLEADLQVTLFDRHARGISPTAAGQRLHGAVREALSLILAAARDLREGDTASEEVRVSVSPSFGARWLLPRLPRFAAAHPAVRVIPAADNRLVNLDAEDFDFAVRYTERPETALEAVFMMGEELCAVAAPQGDVGH